MKVNQTLYYLVILLFLFSGKGFSQEVTITNLFEALESQPETESDILAVEKAKTGKQQANSALYPKISAFGRYDNTSIATGMVPVPPNVLFPLLQDQSIPQPFSKEIYTAGVNISMPIFVKSIYTLASQAKYLEKSAEAKKEINLLQNEAVIVASNANLLYLESLTDALENKKRSLLKTKEIIEIKVDNGRAPGSSLLVINSSINQVETSKNDIAIKREEAIATIENLTDIRLEAPIEMFEVKGLETENMKALEPLEQKVKADKLGWRSEKERLWPSLSFFGNYYNSFADSYNNNMAIDRDFTSFGLSLNVPIFNKTQYAKIKKSKITYNETKNELDKLELSFKSQVNQLTNSLQLLKRSEKLYKQNIKDKAELLKIARVSYESNRISIEDYLKYEDDLLLEKSKLYKAQAEKWQTLVKLAVIYGNNIEDIIK